MALAVKDTQEAAGSRIANRLALASLTGTAYLLVGIAAAFYLIPRAWDATVSRLFTGGSASIVDRTLLLLVILAAIGGIIALGLRLVGSTPPSGLRAGIFAGFIGTVLIVLLTSWIGRLFERALGPESFAGLAMTVIVGVGLLALGASLYFRPGFDRWLVSFEDQGWFTAAPYKKNQGQRVRRATILGILILIGCGIYTLLVHDSLRTASRHWELPVPFSGNRTITFLPDVQFTVPILLAAAALWFAYRIVNYPVFADFLIATEAELNKVSWTTRRRLIQDTIVVLTTVFLFTVFLFAVDAVCYLFLSDKILNVIQSPDQTIGKKVSPDEW